MDVYEKMVIDEVKSAIQKRKKYVTVAQIFADVALNLRKKGFRVRGKKVGGMDTIKKIWHNYCLKDHYWAHIYSKIVAEARTFTGLHNDREVLALKEYVKEMLASLKNISTEDMLVIIAETGLSEKTITKIKKELKELHRTKSKIETCNQHDSEDNFGKAATTIEKEIRYLKEKVQHLEANMLFIKETVQDISIATTGLETYKATVDVIQQQQVFRRLEELEEKFKEADYFNKKFSQLEEILPGIINKSNQIDEVSARLAALEQAYEKVSGALNEVEAVKEVVREMIGEGNGQVLVRLNALEQGFREMTRLFGDVRKITEAITDVRKTLNQYTADRVTLARFFWQQVEMWRELHKVWSKNGTSSDRPAVRCLSVHKDDTSPFDNAGMI